jgi:hypothetical protein
MTIHLAVGEGRSNRLGNPMMDCSSDDICESAKRRNWIKGLSSLEIEDREGGVVVDAVVDVVALDVSEGGCVSGQPFVVCSDGTGAIFASEQINVADKAALAGYRK